MALVFSAALISNLASADVTVGSHEHRLIFHGETKAIEPKSENIENAAPLSKPHLTYDHDLEGSSLPKMDAGIELDLSVRSLEFTLEERFVDHEKIWHQ